MKRKIIIFLITILLFSQVIHAKGPVVVSSRNDTEGTLLGNMIMLVLMGNNFLVEDKIGFGSTTDLRKAIKKGAIDIYPEYTGNGIFFFYVDDKDVFRNFQKGYETVKKFDLERNDIAWLTPAPANNTWAVAGREDFCRDHKIVTMEDFGKFVSHGGYVKLAASQEFVNRHDALPAFQYTYKFVLRNNQLAIYSDENTLPTETAAAENRDGINFAMAYGTDGALATLGLRVLKDNKSVQPVYAPAPIIRKDLLDKYPEIENLLKDVFLGLDLEILQELNSRVAIMGYPAKDVAKEYLLQKGFIH